MSVLSELEKAEYALQSVRCIQSFGVKYVCVSASHLANPTKSVTVGMAVTRHHPHRSVREELPHTAHALSFDAEAGNGIRMH